MNSDDARRCPERGLQLTPMQIHHPHGSLGACDEGRFTASAASAAAAAISVDASDSQSIDGRMTSCLRYEGFHLVSLSQGSSVLAVRFINYQVTTTHIPFRH